MTTTISAMAIAALNGSNGAGFDYWPVPSPSRVVFDRGTR
jgi:hypothetical protein